jgi:hypothetical protein
VLGRVVQDLRYATNDEPRHIQDTPVNATNAAGLRSSGYKAPSRLQLASTAWLGPR